MRRFSISHSSQDLKDREGLQRTLGQGSYRFSPPNGETVSRPPNDPNQVHSGALDVLRKDRRVDETSGYLGVHPGADWAATQPSIPDPVLRPVHLVLSKQEAHKNVRHFSFVNDYGTSGYRKDPTLAQDPAGWSSSS